MEKSVTINQSPDELYRFWRRFETLPRFMRHVESVTQGDDEVSHWVVKTATGRKLQWNARVIEDRPGEMISWQSLEGADVDNAGSVWFTPAPGGSGTVVKLSMKYSPPSGRVGNALAKLLGDGGERQIAEDLSSFKKLMERSDEDEDPRGIPRM